MLLLKVKKLSLYSSLEFLFGQKIRDKMFGVILFKEEHIIILILQGR
jgi:hypothetical protein